MSKLCMAYHRQRFSRWLLTISAVSVLLGLLTAPCLLARAAPEALVTTDYLVSHMSSESFYAQYKLDPQVVLRVREVVLAGRERTVPKEAKCCSCSLAAPLQALLRLTSTMSSAR